MLEKLASAIYNDIVSGLVGITSTPTISKDQLIDDVVDERLQIIKEYSLKNLMPRKDLLMSITCITPSKESLDRCPVSNNKNLTWHFELPQLINDFADEAIEFIGPSDKKTRYVVYTSTSFNYHKYKRRGCALPFVYIDTSPNCNNMYDAWVFNLPTVKTLTFIGIIKDPRQLEIYPCCAGEEGIENYTFLSAEIKKRLTEKKIRYYKQLYLGPTPNTQVPK
jgi:hypothetical protein